MADPKNPFDFGTGSIDKDQWLKDIDNEQEGFVSQYANAANKHRTTLLRLAFQDLRNRIASGDMLSRTADGLYQFGSALISGDKHMQEAYQRALGFMGGLARRQINTPAPEPEKKSVGNIEERWIKSLNPSGTYNKSAYWKNQTDEDRKTNLINFLNGELTKVKNHEYNDYGGFTDESTLTNRLNSVLTALNSGKANDWTLQQLGFTKNWLQQPEEEKEEEAPKTEEDKLNDQLAEQQRQLKLDVLKQQVLLGNNATVAAPIYFNLPNYSYSNALDKFIRESNDDSAVWYRNTRDAGKYAASNTGNTSPFGADTLTKAYNGAKKAFTDLERKSLDSYFSNLGINYASVYNNKEKQGEFLANLSRLFTNNGSTYLDLITKYLTPIGNGKFYINGSLNLGGHYSYFMPKSYNLGQAGIFDASLGRQKDQNEYLQGMYDELYSYKEGGVIKFLEGGISGDEYNKYIKPYAKAEKSSTIAQGTSDKQENNSFSNAENARIAATIADIASMGAAFVPGYGTAASAVLGLGSTATNFGADLADGQGLWNATKNAGFGLAADVMGLIPGLGGVGKGAKIARNLMWAVPKMMQWVNTIQGLQNAGEIKKSITKLAAPSSMTVQDWQNVSQALQIMTGHGRSVATKVKKAGMSKTTTTTDPEYYVFTNKGKLKVSDETFKKLREVRGTKARLALTEELMGKGVELQQTRFAPWNTSTKLGAFKEVPGQTNIEVQNKHKGMLSDENLVEKAENFNPSVDIRGIINKVNPYKSYYSKRAKKSVTKLETPKLETSNKNTTPQNDRGLVWNESTHSYIRTKKIGGILKTLRNGGIIKAEDGWNTRGQYGGYGKYVPVSIDGGGAPLESAGTQAPTTTFKWEDIDFYKQQLEPVKTPTTEPTVAPPLNDQPFIPDWYMQRFNNSQAVKNLPNLAKHTTGLKERQSGTNLNYAYFMNDAYANSGLANKLTDIQNYFNQSPNLKANNLQELITFYNNDIDTLYSPFNNGGFDYTKDDATSHNNLFKKVYGSRSDKTEGGERWDIGWDATTGTLKTAGSATHARRPVNYEKSFDDELKTDPEKAKQRVAQVQYRDINGKVYVDENGRLLVLSPEQEKALEGKPKDSNPDGNGNVVDRETELGTTYPTKIKNPFDPTLLLNSAKLATSLLGNADIYKNLLAEMPQAPLRDGIDRKLAIVGDLRSIDEARNKIADLRHIQRQLQGSDQLVNFASALEAERVGRDIMDNGFKNDAARQFDTALKSWNIDNADIMYNTQVADANRGAIADRARMMAQIRAAYRNGNWNAIKNFVDDTSFWALKKYQTEKDLADAAKRELLGDFDSYVTTELYNDKEYAGQWKSLQLKVINGTATPDDRQRMEAIKAARLRKLRQDYSNKYYNLYHDPTFGGGVQTMIAKEGGSLEKEKLKARGKDNDRYVSMIKDLRKTSYRRRRR